MVNRLKKTIVTAVKTISEAFTKLSGMKNTQIEINKLVAERDERLKVIQAEYQARLDPLEAKRGELFQNIFDFVNRNKKDFGLGQRSRKNQDGEFGIRLTTPKVEVISGFKENEILEAMLENPDLVDYVHIVATFNKEAMLRDRPVVTGVAYTQKDQIFAKPKILKEDGKTETLCLDV